MWTKNGSIPKPETDGTEGWIEVPMPPDCPDGKEVVWLNWEWVIRDPKPEDRDGFRWKWNHDNMQWVEYALEKAEEKEIIFEANSLATEQIEML